MPRPKPKKSIPYYFDTVTLSNFALCGKFELLVGRYGLSLVLTEQVRVELSHGRSGGYAELEQIENELTKGRISIAAVMSSPEAILFGELISAIGSGEAACIAMAKHRGGVVVTDDLLARRTCASYGVRVSGTIGILKAMCLDQVIVPAAADALLTEMAAKGFYSPVRRISDLL